MKKPLFMCALGLTIATSMVAGTMAVYTHADELNGSVETARAKHFFVDVNSENSSNVNLKLAPGQYADWDFTMTNKDDVTGIVSETNTDVKIAISSGTINNWNDFTIQLVDTDGTVLQTATKSGNEVFINMSDEFKAGVEKNIAYKLRFVWDDASNGTLSDEADTNLVWNLNDTDEAYPDAAGIKVTITGTQSASDQAVIE